jgi:hypothetical protein
MSGGYSRFGSIEMLCHANSGSLTSQLPPGLSVYTSFIVLLMLEKVCYLLLLKFADPWNFADILLVVAISRYGGQTI